MAEVKWQARRVSDGVLVDVTGDTTGTPASAPTANALEAGSASVYMSAADPGAVGAGALWVQLYSGGALAALRVRNALNTAWVEVTVAHDNGAGNYESYLGFDAGGGAGGNAPRATFNLNTPNGTSFSFNDDTAIVIAGPDDNTEIRQGIADPSAGAGIAAPRGSLYQRNAATGELWLKTGAANTAWSKVTTA